MKENVYFNFLSFFECINVSGFNTSKIISLFQEELSEIH